MAGMAVDVVNDVCVCSIEEGVGWGARGLARGHVLGHLWRAGSGGWPARSGARVGSSGGSGFGW